MASNEGSAKIAALGLLAIILLFTGCMSTEEKCAGGFREGVWNSSPEVGTVIDHNEIVSFTEKWREIESDGSFTYYARMISGRDIVLNPTIYETLPVNQTGVGYGFGNGFSIYGPETVCGFYPANVSPYQDIKNRMVVVP